MNDWSKEWSQFVESTLERVLNTKSDGNMLIEGDGQSARDSLPWYNSKVFQELFL